MLVMSIVMWEIYRAFDWLIVASLPQICIMSLPPPFPQRPLGLRDASFAQSYHLSDENRFYEG